MKKFYKKSSSPTKISLIIIAFLTSVLLSGCVSAEEAVNATDEEQANDKYTDTIVTEVVKMLDVGEELKAEKIAKGDTYSIMYETDTGELKWLELLMPGYSSFKVKRSDRDYSYLVREKNMKSIWGWAPVFVLYWYEEDGLAGGVIEESCGKDCTKETKNEILD